MNKKDDPGIWSRLSRTGGGTLLGAVILIGFFLGPMFPLDVPFLSDPLDVLASMILYAVMLVVVVYLLWWVGYFIQ